MRPHSSSVLVAFIMFALAACEREPAVTPSSTPDTSDASWVTEAVSAREVRAQREADRELFIAWCGICHGDDGRGTGPAAASMSPMPRDLTRGSFKIRSTPSGTPPARQDVFDTLTRGLPGSAMPSFAFLTEAERRRLVEYVWNLSGLEEEGEPVAIGTVPPASEALIERGREMYLALGCDRCHGAEGRGDGPSSDTLEDDMGQPIPARDYSKGLYLGGDSPEALYLRLVAGIDGTGMPSYQGSFEEEDGFAIAHYLLSLKEDPPPPPADPVARGRALVDALYCRGCHQLEGEGPRAAPSLDVAAGKLQWDWAKRFLSDPLESGSIYPYLRYRMPDFHLDEAAIDDILAYVALVAGRGYPETPEEVEAPPTELVEAGGLLYMLRCTECHNMGGVVPTPRAKQQGPDLIHVTDRLRFDWMEKWIAGSNEIDRETRMWNPNLTPDQVQSVRAFVWHTSLSGND